MRQKTKRWWLTAVVLLVLGAAAYYAKQQWFSTSNAPTYVTATVTRGNVEKSVLASGKLEGFQQVSVGAQVSGQLKYLAVELGQNVKAGDLIAEIDSLPQQNALRNAEAALTTARADLASLQATLAQVKATYERQKQLRAADASSRAEFEAAEQAYKVAMANIESQKARIAQAEIAEDTAQVNLGYTRIVAPMDGQVVSIVTKEGQTVNANQTTPTIIVLAQLDTMTIKAEISEADVTRVQPGLPVYFTILGEPNRRYEAKLRSIEPAPESISTTGTTSSTTSATTTTAVYYNGLFDVPNEDHSLRISMTAQVYIVQGSATDVLTIPSSGLGRRSGRSEYTVRVLDAQGNANPVKIEVGMNNNIVAEVVSGLNEGDRIVLSDSTGPSAARGAPGARPGSMPGAGSRPAGGGGGGH